MRSWGGGAREWSGGGGGGISLLLWRGVVVGGGWLAGCWEGRREGVLFVFVGCSWVLRTARTGGCGGLRSGNQAGFPFGGRDGDRRAMGRQHWGINRPPSNFPLSF